MAMNDAQWSDLILHCYASASTDVGWNGLAQRIAAAFEGDSAILKSQATDAQVEVADSTANFDICLSDPEWAAHWQRNDLWAERARLRGLPTVALSQDLLDPREFESSGFYWDWTRQLGIYHVVGAMFEAGPGHVGVMAVHRPRGAPAFDERDRHRMSLLFPHLQQVLALRRLHAQTELIRSASMLAMEQQDIPLLVTDTLGLLQCTNLPAEQLLRKARVLSVSGRQVAATDRDTDERIRGDLAVLAAMPAGKMGPALPARPLLVHDSEAGNKWWLSLSPWVRSEDPAALRVLWTLKSISAPRHLGAMRELLRRQFALTPRELDVAVALASGQSVAEIAGSLALTEGHVRQRLKVLFVKTGVRSQAQLVSRFNSLS